MEDLWGVERPACVSVDDDGTRRKQGQEQGQGSSAPCHSLLSLSSLLFYVLQFKEQKKWHSVPRTRICTLHNGKQTQSIGMDQNTNTQKQKIELPPYGWNTYIYMYMYNNMYMYRMQRHESTEANKRTRICIQVMKIQC